MTNIWGHGCLDFRHSVQTRITLEVPRRLAHLTGTLSQLSVDNYFVAGCFAVDIEPHQPNKSLAQGAVVCCV